MTSLVSIATLAKDFNGVKLSDTDSQDIVISTSLLDVIRNLGGETGICIMKHILEMLDLKSLINFMYTSFIRQFCKSRNDFTLTQIFNEILYPYKVFYEDKFTRCKEQYEMFEKKIWRSPRLARGIPIIVASKRGLIEDVKLFIKLHDNEATGMTLAEMLNQVGGDSLDYGYNKTALCVAARYGRVNVVQYLLQQREVDPTLADAGTWTPLHNAACYSRKKVIQILLENKLVLNAINQKDDSGRTPLDLVYEKDYAGRMIKQETADFMRSKGGKRAAELIASKEPTQRGKKKKKKKKR